MNGACTKEGQEKCTGGIPVANCEKLTVIPYVADYAEYAAKTRAEIIRRKGTDFIVAVDLPQGLEDEILRCVRALPEPALIIDALKRSILVTPSSAPVEAVRSYLEYGYEMHCIDASLPVSGNFAEYEYFIQMCRLHGPENVIVKSEQYGILREEIFRAWVSSSSGAQSATPGFHSLPQRQTVADCPPFNPAFCSPYRLTRLQCMAMHVNKLLRSGLEVLLVCSRANVSGILANLSADLRSLDDSYRLPVRVCRVPEKVLHTLAREIPFVTYAYELYRDVPFDRGQWIRRLYTEDCGEVAAQQISGAADYASRLALADEQVYPDLYNLTAAAKFMLGDSQAFRVYNKAIAYPPARDIMSNCTFGAAVDYDFNPLGETRVLTLKTSVLDQKLRPLNPKSRDTWSSSSYYRFTRTRKCLQAELDLMKFLKSRFGTATVSETESRPVEFTCGLKNGIDYRRTIRNRFRGRVCVRQPVFDNNTCYVLDYRPFQKDKKTQAPSAKRDRYPLIIIREGDMEYPTHVFFDKNYPWIGTALHAGNHYVSKVMMAFSSLPFSPTKIYGKVHYTDPLPSAADLGLKYAKNVVIFTDRPEELPAGRRQGRRLKAYPMKALPPHMQEKMRTFDIVGYRSDDRPGD